MATDTREKLNTTNRVLRRGVNYGGEVSISFSYEKASRRLKFPPKNRKMKHVQHEVPIGVRLLREKAKEFEE